MAVKVELGDIDEEKILDVSRRRLKTLLSLPRARRFYAEQTDENYIVIKEDPPGNVIELSGIPLEDMKEHFKSFIGE